MSTGRKCSSKWNMLTDVPGRRILIFQKFKMIGCPFDGSFGVVKETSTFHSIRTLYIVPENRVKRTREREKRTLTCDHGTQHDVTGELMYDSIGMNFCRSICSLLPR